MADEKDKGAPSLEPPSFFRRKKRPEPDQVPEPVSEQAPRTPPPPPPPPPPRMPPPPARPADTATTILDVEPPSTQPRPPAPPPIPPVYSDQATEQAALEPKARRKPRESQGPVLPAPLAAGIVGLLIGGFIVGATTLALGLCTKIEGTESCGNPGFLLDVAILVLAVFLGAVLLRLTRVPEPGSTSFLAVGLLSVVALLFLIDQLLEWWMIIAIPVLSVLTYLAAQWVTARFTEPDATETPPVGDDWFHYIR